MNALLRTTLLMLLGFRANKKKNTQHRIFLSKKEKAIVLNIFLAIRGLGQGEKEEDISWICDKGNAHV